MCSDHSPNFLASFFRLVDRALVQMARKFSRFTRGLVELELQDEAAEIPEDAQKENSQTQKV